MKVEHLETLVQSINDAEVAVALIKYFKEKNLNDEDFKLYANALKEHNYNRFACSLLLNEHVTKKQIPQMTKLLKILKECNYNEFVAAIIKDCYLTGILSYEDTINLINELKECEFHDCAKEFVSFVGTRSVKELVKFMKKLKEKEYNYHAYLLMYTALNKNLSYEDTIKLLEKLEKYNYNEYQFGIVVDDNVIETRTTDEKIQLMKALEECENCGFAYLVATDCDVLSKRNVNGQIDLMKNAHDESTYQIAINSEELDKSLEEQLEAMKIQLAKNKNAENYEWANLDDVLEDSLLDMQALKKYVLAIKNQKGLDYDIDFYEKIDMSKTK